MSTIKKGWFHKKGLGFVSTQAATLVQKQDVLECKKRFFVLVNPNKEHQPWQLRYYKAELQSDDDYFIPLQDVVSDPAQSLKGCFQLDEHAEVILGDGVMSLCTKERTLLLRISDEDESGQQEWFAMIDSYIASRRQLAASIETTNAKRTSLVLFQSEAQPSNAPAAENTQPRRPSIFDSLRRTASARRASSAEQQSSSTSPVRRPSSSRVQAPSSPPQAAEDSTSPSASSPPATAPATSARAIVTVVGDENAENEEEDLKSLENILASREMRSKFREFVKAAFAEENLNFYEAVEKHMTIPESDVVARKRSAVAIADKFVKDTGEEQVNLSYSQSLALVESLSSSDAAAIGHITLCLLQCQREILELMKRKFLHRFNASLEQEEHRQVLLRSGGGCFTSLYQRSGVEAFSILFAQLKSMQEDNKLLIMFLQKRFAVSKAFLTGSLVSCGEQFKDVHIAETCLSSATKALRSTFDSFDLHARSISEYLDGMRDSVLSPLQIMSETMDQSLLDVKKQLGFKIDKVVVLRDLAIKLGSSELKARETIVNMSRILAELESQGKPREKELKRQMALFDKLRADATVIERNRANTELELAVKESEASEDILGALLQLESVALYRLDTVKSCLSKLVYAEQRALSRLSLKFEGTLTDCLNLNSITDLISMAHEIERVAVEAQEKHVTEMSRHTSQDTPEVHEAVVEEEIPMAELVTTWRKSRRWL